MSSLKSRFPGSSSIVSSKEACQIWSKALKNRLGPKAKMGDDLSSKAAEMMKKVLAVGVGTLFLTEESLRGLISEFKLPKELLAGILESAQKTKDDFLKSFSREILAQVMDRVDPSALLQELVEKNEIDLKIQVSFKPKK
jgi:hypothetical protein